jgi:hypothetical protein
LYLFKYPANIFLIANYRVLIPTCAKIKSSKAIVQAESTSRLKYNNDLSNSYMIGYRREKGQLKNYNGLLITYFWICKDILNIDNLKNELIVIHSIKLAICIFYRLQNSRNSLCDYYIYRILLVWFWTIKRVL